MLFLFLAFLLVFAPLFFGGNRPLPLLVLELAGLAGLAVLAWARGTTTVTGLPAPLSWAIGILLVAPLLQLVPLPASWWAALPGHGPYGQALEFAGTEAARAMRPLSVHPRATEYSWLVLIPCLAAFLLTRAQPRSRVRKLAMLFVAVAMVEATLGISQLGVSSGSWLHFGHPAGMASGTYVNKNHFAALMAMALPMAVALWGLEAMPPHGREELKHHPRHADRKLAMHILLSMLVLLLLVALLFTRSRGGIGSGLLAFALATLALVWRTGSRAARTAFTLVGAAALGFAAYIGLTPVLERFAPDQLSLGYDGRLAIAAASLRAGMDFLPFGSGLGTFADVFRRYQVEGLSGYIDHAHNDYAELFLELGVAGLAVMALLAVAYVMRWALIMRARSSRSLAYLQVAAGLGMLAMIAHAFVDFNFHIPANALYFSFLAGIFFFTPGEDRA